MDKVKAIYYGTLAGLSAAGSVAANLLGGWDTALQTLCIMMAADYLTGIVCALVWKKSPKSTDGAFESKASIKGLFRKAGILLAVLVATQLYKMTGTDFCRTASVMFFVANDGLSVVENLGLMGLPMPAVIKNAFELLKKKGDTEATTENKTE